MSFLDDIALDDPALPDFFDELPLWSATFGRMLLDRVPLTARQTILDVGAGTGWLSLELAQRCGERSRVYAVDPWQRAMERLCRKVEFLGLTNVTLVVKDAAETGLPDASVDLIVSNLGINNFRNKEAVLKECCRVARPGASLFLTTNPSGHMAEFYAIFRETLIQLDRRHELAALDAHVAHRGNEESVGSLLRDAGFEHLVAYRDSFRIRFADGAALLRHHFVRLAFLPGWKSVVDPAAHGEFFATLESNLNTLAAEKGDLSLQVPMLCLRATRP
jgi:arsenite methyltransferase